MEKSAKNNPDSADAALLNLLNARGLRWSFEWLKRFLPDEDPALYEFCDYIKEEFGELTSPQAFCNIYIDGIYKLRHKTDGYGKPISQELLDRIPCDKHRLILEKAHLVAGAISCMPVYGKIIQQMMNAYLTGEFPDGVDEIHKATSEVINKMMSDDFQPKEHK